MVNGKAPAQAGAFFDLSSIVADWEKLSGERYLFCLHGVKWFGELTRIFAGVLAVRSENEQREQLVDQFLGWLVWPSCQLRQELAG